MEKKFEIQAVNNITVTAEDIDDIMCTALEGGITDWCGRAKVVGEYLGEYGHEQIARGSTLLLYDMVEDEEYKLTREDLLNGIKLAYEQGYYEDYEWCNGRCIDTCSVDADVADVIIQMAIFEEVIYG